VLAEVIRPVTLVMTHRMLRGIKVRAERHARPLAAVA
jgi:hypothetical protein